MKYLVAILLITLAAPNLAFACRGPFPEPITIQQATTGAKAVFLGKVIEIQEGLPANFAPTDKKAYDSRITAAKRNGHPAAGSTVMFKPIKIFKGEAISTTIQVINLHSTNTCEWPTNVEVGDEMLVFASTYGNQLSFPSGGFDGKAQYTIYNPSKRATLDAPMEWQDKMQKHFDEILRTLSPLNP